MKLLAMNFYKVYKEGCYNSEDYPNGYHLLNQSYFTSQKDFYKELNIYTFQALNSDDDVFQYEIEIYYRDFDEDNVFDVTEYNKMCEHLDELDSPEDNGFTLYKTIIVEGE